MSILTAKKPFSVPGLEAILEPYGTDRFINDYLGKKQLVIQRNDPDYYQHLFSIDLVDYILDVNRPQGDSLRIVKNQVPLMPSKYINQDGSLNLNQIYAAYADGHTVVINELDRFWLPVKELCQQISTTLSYLVKANMYLTPKQQSALLPHYDTHDVLVVQVAGTKHWYLYDAPVDTPLLHSHQPVFKREQLRNKQEITLRAGDFMYMPRGIPHEAFTTDDSSLHITLGVYPQQWVDLIVKAIHHAALSNVGLRRALPAGFLNSDKWDESFSQQMTTQFQSLVEDLTKDNQVGQAVGMLAEDYRNQFPVKGDGHFRMLDQMDQISLDTLLQKRDGMASSIQEMGLYCRIIFPGNVIRGPYHIAPALRFICDQTGPFRLSDLPQIKDHNKIKLAARLIRGGLLRVL